MTSGFKQCFKDTAGNVALITALGAVPLVLAAGVAIDMSRASNAQVTLQSAVDSAALAAARWASTDENASKADATRIIEDYMKLNVAPGAFDSISHLDVKIDKKDGSIDVKVTGRLRTSLMKVAGISELDISANTEVNLGYQALEVALVLDNTGSMNNDGKLDSLKSAAKLMVSTLSADKAEYVQLKFGIVPFGKYVNVGLANRTENWIDVPTDDATNVWNGCVGSRDAWADSSINGSDKYPGIMNVACPSPITPLTADLDLVRAEIDKMVATGATYIPQGLLWGWHTLDDRKPYAEALSKSKREALRGKRAVVLMTDGENTVAPVHPIHLDRNELSSAGIHTYAETTVIANGITAQTCEAIKADDIEIYTVALKITDQPTKDMLEVCASNPAMAYDADNSVALQAAFGSIANQLAALRLTK